MLCRRVGVDVNLSHVHPDGPFRPSQFQAWCWNVRLCGKIMSREVLPIRTDLHLAISILHSRIALMIVLSPFGDLVHLTGGQERFDLFMVEFGVERLTTGAHQAFHTITLLLAVQEVWTRLCQRSEDDVLIEALLLRVRHDWRWRYPSSTRKMTVENYMLIQKQ